LKLKKKPLRMKPSDLDESLNNYLKRIKNTIIRTRKLPHSKKDVSYLTI